MKRFVVLAVTAVALTLRAATFTVTTTNDSGAGSLRAALTAANAAPGANLITFNIPGPGVQTIAPQTALPVITNTITLDGYTQPGSQPNTSTTGNNATLLIRLNGANLPVFTPGLKLQNSSGSVVRGLVIVGCPGDGINLTTCANCAIGGNWIGLDVDNLINANSDNGVNLTTSLGQSTGNIIGGVTPDARNVISGNANYGVYLFPSSVWGNAVEGNFIGTDVAGALPRGNSFGGIFIQSGTNNVIGGASAPARNIISANGLAAGGSGLYILGGTATRVQNNYIGTDVTGKYALGNGGYGIGIQSGSISGCLIGGAGAGNLICNNLSHGIFLLGASTNVITGNTIGTDPSGQLALGNMGAGIYVFSGTWNTLGDVTPGSGNVIRFNAQDAVNLAGGANTSVRGNLLADNRGLTIDCGANFQFYPQIAALTNDGAHIFVAGQVTNAPLSALNLDFYAAPGPNLSGQPQAEVYLGSTPVTTGSGGLAQFSVSLVAAIASNWVVSATTTDAAHNTSILSPMVAPLYAPPMPASLVIALNESGTQVITWPSAKGNYSLQTVYSLSAPIQWQPVTNGISDNGTTKTCQVPINAAVTNQFFRLKFP